MNVVYIVIGILLFGVLVMFHEFGHFITAKLFGVGVDEFSVGMGPAIFKRQKGETLYAVRCIPFGGYCAMRGEDEESEDPRAFTSAKKWKRAIILFAGSFNNFLLGFIIMLILYSNAAAFNAPLIEGFMDGCPYESAEGLQTGDRFVRIDGKKVLSRTDISAYLDDGRDYHDIVLSRDGKRVKLQNFYFVPRQYEGEDSLYYGFFMGTEEASFGVKIRYAWYETLDFSRLVWQSLRMLTNGEAGVNDLTGPVGIVDLMAETGEQAESVGDALFGIFYIGALITVNLAIMNLLPIPALDGGRIFFLVVTWIIESITRRKLDPKYEGYVHTAGFVLLIGLMIYIMGHDVVRLIKG